MTRSKCGLIFIADSWHGKTCSIAFRFEARKSVLGLNCYCFRQLNILWLAFERAGDSIPGRLEFLRNFNVSADLNYSIVTR